jgi:hypothetical protein
MVKNDPEEFSARVLDLLEDDELHLRKSQEAKIHAMAWSIEEVTNKLVKIYDDTRGSYYDEYGPRRMPVWELMTNKRWWLMYKKMLKKKLSPKSRRKRMDVYSAEPRSEGSLD